MSLKNYALACTKLEEELIESLDADEIRDLRIFCNDIGHDGWLDWTLQNLDIVCEYVSAMPHERQSLLQDQAFLNRERLVLAAYQHVRRGHILLDAATDPRLQPDGSHREVACDAGKLFFEYFYLQDRRSWPFDAPNPFAEEVMF